MSKGEQEGGEMKEDFAQAEQYDGFREGYVFKKGSQGLGCGFPSPALCPSLFPQPCIAASVCRAPASTSSPALPRIQILQR